MRTIIDIPNEDERVLRRLAKKCGKSRSALIRQSIKEYLERNKFADGQNLGFGLWKNVNSADDGLAYERTLRGEWE